MKINSNSVRRGGRAERRKVCHKRACSLYFGLQSYRRQELRQICLMLEGPCAGSLPDVPDPRLVGLWDLSGAFRSVRDQPGEARVAVKRLEVGVLIDRNVGIGRKSVVNRFA
jgi:hypothetical protein